MTIALHQLPGHPLMALPTRLIPLGAWCRTAYQCRLHSKTLGLEIPPTLPFDWTISPYRSISKILRGDISNCLILNEYDSFINKTGSVSCGYTGLTSHHDLSPSVSESLGCSAENQVPSELLWKSIQHRQAIDRFMHTYGNLISWMRKPGNVFVRWMYGGPGSVGVNFPDVFLGESPQRLRSLIRNVLHHDDFYLVHFYSLPTDADTYMFKHMSSGKFTYSGVLYERIGWNGDGSSDFRGDENAWGQLLKEALSSFS
jgi:hypothetical protein